MSGIRSTRLWLPLLSILLIPGLCRAAEPDGTCGFETREAGETMTWGGGPPRTLLIDEEIFHSGARAMGLHRTADSEGSFSTVTLSLPADRDGGMVELRGWLKSEDVDGRFGLWLRLDGNGGMVGFDNMNSRPLSGTTDWTEYRIVLPFAPEARQVVFGALVAGTGAMWVDDLSLWVDGRPWAEAPVVVREPTVIDTDTEFAGGSGFLLTAPGEVQADNLALLGRVWGFLKYHHPAVTGGERQWDFDLFRILPDVAAAPDLPAAQAVLARWVEDLGPAGTDSVPAVLPDPADLALAPDLAWLDDTALLGDDLSALLGAAYAARPADGESFWVGFAPRVGNPDFSVEPAYAKLQVVDPGYRLLALFRFWNMVEYWCPNRDVIGEDWPGELRASVPLLLAAEGTDYSRELLRLVARLNDTHTQLYGELEMRPPGMAHTVPARARWTEERPVVWNLVDAGDSPAPDLQPGDEILAVDGVPWPELFAAWRPYYSASNEMQRLDDLANALLRGPAGETTLRVRRDGEEIDVVAERIESRSLDRMAGRWHTRPGPALQMLDEGVAYLKLEAIKRDSVQTWFERIAAADAPGLVLDCRAYPGDFPIFDVGGHLVATSTPFTTITRPDPANPGAFLWDEGQPLLPIDPLFDGPVAILVDESSQSSAEYHALAWRAAPGAFVMGGTTSGADGNVSRFVLPGNITTMFSGIGIYDARRNPTQRVGIVPDLRVEPTVAGVREGRDEVLEAAVAEILARADAAPRK